MAVVTQPMMMTAAGPIPRPTAMQGAVQAQPVGGAVPFNPVAQQPVPQYGLAGAEQAARAGMQGGVQALQTGQNRAMGMLHGGNQFAQNQLGQARGLLGGALAGGMSQLQQGATGALGQLQAGQGALSGSFGASAGSVDPRTGQPLFQQAAQGVQAYSPTGLQAQKLQAALSGVGGQEAFDQALIESPAQKFLREQGERSIVN
ncbi:MAG: hypothetical protein GY954_03865, partial [Alteromonas sp.]|nr:hypothetical protein [Alteromonas sp.]